MASTSASSIQKSFKYDVFLSFRGEDTRNNFVSHLHKALEENGILTYKDDEKIEKGETIDNQLKESIEDSRFFIIVFSKDYAGSSWCLDELVKIMECQKTSEQTAYPVFYDVEPTEVRYQSGAVEKAFEKYENKKDARKWRKTLKEAADLAGWESKKTANGDESKLIQIIVDDIFKKICSSNPSVDRKLVGMETRILDFLSSLEFAADDVRMIGIWGMGGGGKTTLARAVFDRISIQFDGKAFVENVREVSKSSLNGLNKLQQQVLSSVLSKGNITVNSVHEGTNMMKRMIRGRKVLIVLDDVDDIEQLEALAGELDWFKLGSRVIITTRDKQVLLSHRVKFINEVSLLSHMEAICLLSRYAFKRDIPIEGYEELLKEVVQYADGLPLTIKVLGSLLCGQNVPQWIDTLERLEKIPLKATMEILELSYNSLEEDYKEMFLDVACLLKGWKKEDAVIALESCGFFAEVGLRVLEQRCLINISKNGELQMHDHIEEMGKNIVRRLNPNEPKRHNRLWIHEEIVDILANDSGTQATKCITLEASELNCKILMKGLANMKELRFLQVYSPSVRNFDEDSVHFPNALRFLRWNHSPFSSVPKTFQAENLVGLDMLHSKMVQLWKDGEEKPFLKHRFLKFSRSHRLRTLDLSVAPNLETLILDSCDNLVEVHFQVTPNLKKLCIDFCHEFENLHMPAESPKLRSVDLLYLKLRTLHLGVTPNLKTLRVKDCNRLGKLHMPAECPNLEAISLEDCRDLVELQFPAECPKLITVDLHILKLTSLQLGITPILETLKVKDCTDMVELQIPAECPRLKRLKLNNLKLMFLHLGITPKLVTLSLIDCRDLVELHLPFRCPQLKTLSLDGSKLRNLHLGSTPDLETLSLAGCDSFAELHMPFGCPKLKFLSLSNTKLSNLDLGLTPNLQMLDLKDCHDLVEINTPFGCLKKFLYLEVTSCQRLESLSMDKRLFDDGSVSGFCVTVEFFDAFSSHFETNSQKSLLTSFHNQHPDFSVVNLEKLISVCNLEISPVTICDFHCLRKLTLKGGIPEVPEFIVQLEGLEELILLSTKIKHLPESICMLKYLKILELKSCWLLEKLPENFGQLQCLEKLILTECVFLRDIPNSICEMKCLKYIHLPYCIQVAELPEEIGRLECLKELDITGTGISRLPQSIFRVKGLRIIGFRWLLESCGFTSEINTSDDETFCYI